jgi:hypothetical protein
MSSGIRGSVAPYAAESRDESSMKQTLKASGRFPEVGQNHTDFVNKKLEKVRKGNEGNQVRNWRMAQDDRLTAMLEQEKAVSQLQAGRRGPLIGEGGRVRAAQRAAEQVYAP